MSIKRVAVLGEIGSGNLGDDFGYVLVRDALISAFDKLDVLVDIRPVTPNLFGLLDSYHWDAVVTGCGTLLDLGGGPYVRALLTAAARCPIAILGSGLADPRHIRPTAAGRQELRELLDCAKYAWTRTGSDEIPHVAANPDPIWLYGWHGEGVRMGIGINVGHVAFSGIRFDPEWLHMLDAVRDLLTCPSALVAAWRGDVAWLRRLRRGTESIHVVTGTRKSMSILSDLHVLISTRIHLAALAACHGAFPILPNYAEKAADVFSGTEVPHRIVAVNDSAEAICETAAAASATGGRMAVQAVQAAQVAAQIRIAEAAATLVEAWTC